MVINDNVMISCFAFLFGLLVIGPPLRAGCYWIKLKLTRATTIPGSLYGRVRSLASAWLNMHQRFIPQPAVELAPEVAPQVVPVAPEPKLLDFSSAEFSSKIKDGQRFTVIRQGEQVYTVPAGLVTKTGYSVEKKTATPIRDGSASDDKTRKGLLGFYRIEGKTEIQIGGGTRVSLPTARGEMDYIVTNFHVYEDLIAEFNLGQPVYVGSYRGGQFIKVEMKQSDLEALHPKKLYGVDLLHFDYDQRLFQHLQLNKATVSDDRRVGQLFVTSLVDRKPMVSVTKVTKLAMPFMAAHTASTTPGWSGCPVYTADGRLYAVHTCALNGAEKNGAILINAIYPKTPMMRLVGLEKESDERKYDWFNDHYDMEADKNDIQAVFGDQDSLTLMFQDSKGRRGQLSKESLQDLQEAQIENYVDRAEALARDYENGISSWAFKTEIEDAYADIDAIEDQIAEAYNENDVGQADRPIQHLLDKAERVRGVLQHMMSGYGRESNPGGRAQRRQHQKCELRMPSHGSSRTVATLQEMAILEAHRRAQKASQQSKTVAPRPVIQVDEGIAAHPTAPNNRTPRSSEIVVDAVPKNAEKRGLAKETQPASPPAPLPSSTETREAEQEPVRPRPQPATVLPQSLSQPSVATEKKDQPDAMRKVAHEAGKSLQFLLRDGHVKPDTVLATLLKLVDEAPDKELASKALKDFIYVGGLSHQSPRSL